MKFRESVVVAVAAGCFACAAISQGQQWHSMSDTTGMNGPVIAGTVWDPDGHGPLEPLAVVGGLFTAAVDVVARNVAAWDGQRWHALGEGLPNRVNCLTVWSGKLIAGGIFREVGGHPAEGLAMWDGHAWQPILGLSAGAAVRAMADFNGLLVVAGDFDTANGITVNNIAAYGTTGWSGFDQGLTSSLSEPVASLGVYNGSLYAGGRSLRARSVLLGSLVRWDGQQWVATDVVGGDVFAMTVHDGLLYIAGGHLGPPHSSYPAHRFDGQTWTGLGALTPMSPSQAPLSIAAFRDDVYLAGAFSSTELGLYNVGVAAYNGLSWFSPGGNVNFPAHILLPYGDELLTGGEFLRAGHVSAQFVARWNGKEWLATGRGTNSAVLALAEYRGELLAGGAFRGIAGFDVDGIARWNGRSWRPLGEGLRPPTPTSSAPIVETITPWRDLMLVSGDFRIPGVEQPVNLALWDGQNWTAFDPPIQGRIYAVLPVGKQIFVSALQRDQFGASNHGPFLWTGQEWVTTAVGTSSRINVIARHQGMVIAGMFIRDMIEGVGRWDGQDWRQMGSTLRRTTGGSDTVLAIAEFGGDLYVGGGFDRLADSPVPPLVRWNGGDWEPVLLPANARRVDELVVHDGRLFAAIYVDRPSPQEDQVAVFAWDGHAWDRIGEVMRGVNFGKPNIAAMLSYDEALHVGGNFTVLDDVLVASRHVMYGFTPCYADCDRSTGPGILDIFDFLCFGNRFASNDPYACDCDTSTGLGVCDIFDFLCFGNEFSAGCP